MTSAKLAAQEVDQGRGWLQLPNLERRSLEMTSELILRDKEFVREGQLRQRAWANTRNVRSLLFKPLPPATWIAPTLHLCIAHF